MFKDILINKKISCYTLSKKSGLSYTAVNELFRGERNINSCTVDLLIKLSAALNMSFDDIINKCNERNSIPKSFSKYFWDTKFDELDLIKNKNYIISRLLSKGGYDGTKFVFSSYSYEEIKDVALHSRSLDKYVASFLLYYFKLEKKDMMYYKFASKEWNR